MTAPGWYNAANDPPGTVRYWNGANWVGGPVAQPGATPAAAAASGHVQMGAPGSTGTTEPGGSMLASPAVRMGARAIDFVIGSFVFAIFILSDIGGSALVRPSNGDGYSFVLNDRALDTGFEFFVLGLFLIAWHTLWTHYAGGTPGKLMTGIRVADAATGDTPVSLQMSALRSAIYVTFIVIALSLSLNEAMAGVGLVVGLVSTVLLFVDRRNRTVMDHLAKTIVVRNR